MLPHAPGVQMQTVPEDAITDDTVDEDAEDPDKRMSSKTRLIWQITRHSLCTVYLLLLCHSQCISGWIFHYGIYFGPYCQQHGSYFQKHLNVDFLSRLSPCFRQEDSLRRGVLWLWGRGRGRKEERSQSQERNKTDSSWGGRQRESWWVFRTWLPWLQTFFCEGLSRTLAIPFILDWVGWRK